jgi:uncharacterized DUF497 family protein
MFDWDEENTDHIKRHGLTPEEVEAAMHDRKRVGMAAYNTSTERRSASLGATESGKILAIYYTKRSGKIRVVTAREAKDSEKRRYRRR